MGRREDAQPKEREAQARLDQLHFKEFEDVIVVDNCVVDGQ
jgi:hypothetical protein